MVKGQSTKITLHFILLKIKAVILTCCSGFRFLGKDSDFGQCQETGGRIHFHTVNEDIVSIGHLHDVLHMHTDIVDCAEWRGGGGGVGGGKCGQR